MFLPIVVYGHPILRKISEDIPMDYPDLEKFIKDLFQTMDESDRSEEHTSELQSQR